MRVKRTLDQPSGWIFYLVSGLLAGSALLRSLYAYRSTPIIIRVLTFFAACLILFAIEKPLSNRRPGVFPVYLFLQTCLIGLLLRMPYPSDYFAAMFGVLSMQVIQHFRLQVGAICIGSFTLLIVALLAGTYGITQAIVVAAIYTVVDAFLAFYTLTSQRAQEARSRNQNLSTELQAANQQLEALTAQVQQLAVARERHHLARDLHDSVTQTIFSMTLTTQSALLLLDRDLDRAEKRLERLKQLAQAANSEMQGLISELRPTKLLEGGLASALQQHIAERQLPETLAITLEVDGSLSLTGAEERNLFHIAQEAMNNIVKHSRASQACIRLHLLEPIWMEISDQGQGFDLEHARSAGHVGLDSMGERASEIGWSFQILTSPTKGTLVRVEKSLPKERQAG